MIRTSGLYRRYGAMMAVNNVDLTIPSGTIFGLIGPNGAGKTSTMRMLATLLRPTAGQIEIDGVDAVKDPVSARGRIGYLSDNFGLYDDLFTWEYLDYFCGAYLVEDREQTLEAVLDQVQLRDKRDVMIGKLSRGMRQRVGIARVLLYKPRVILLDEPANGLDPVSRIALYDLLRTLRSGGTTIVISSHILSELSEVCDQVGVMEAGRMVVAGSISDILAKTRTHLTLLLEVHGPAEPAVELLKSYAGVAGFTQRDSSIEFHFSGAREDLPALHRALVSGGVPVISFSPRAENLQDVFLRHSSGSAD